MVEQCVHNLLSKNSAGIKVDRSTSDEDKMVVRFVYITSLSLTHERESNGYRPRDLSIVPHYSQPLLNKL